jgi:electron transfer flavoprotein alpha subunit
MSASFTKLRRKYFVLTIAVCIKQIPLVEDANFDAATRTIRRDGPAVMSAFDLRALSLAINLKSLHGADITVVTMGPPQARAMLVDALAMGADRAIHLEDRAFAGSDTLATARALAHALRRRRYDLILLGKYSLDAETGQVGPELAEMLDIAQVTSARKLEIDGATIRAERESDEGYDEIECTMPVLVTCAERVAQPARVRPGAQEAAGAKPIEVLAADMLSTEPGSFGFAGSPTTVREVFVQEVPVKNCRFIDAADPERAAHETIAALDAMGALSPRPKARRPISAEIRRLAPGRDLWVVCETDLEGEITRGSLELLSRGDELVRQLGGGLVAAGFPASITKHAALMAAYGADRIVVLDSPGLHPYTPEAASHAFAEIIAERKPWGLLLSASERGRDWGPRLAARLGLGLTGDATGIELGDDDRMIALKPAFGGNIIAPILSSTYPQMATVRAGMLELGEPNGDRHAEVEVVRPDAGPVKSRLVREHSLLDRSIAPLEGAEVVIGIGMGAGGPEGIERARELARVLGAGMCATRRVTDLGHMPRQLQVGLTGKAIEARLYFAVGIRGVPNHTVGIKRAQTIVAINSDPKAAIFERSDIGLVADSAQIVPALVDACRIKFGV